MFGNSISAQTPGLLIGMNASMPAASLLLQAARQAAQNDIGKEKNKEVLKISKTISSRSSKENRPFPHCPMPKVVKRKKPAKVITVYSSPVKEVRRKLEVPAELPKYVKELMKTDKNIRRLVRDKSMTIARIAESTHASPVHGTRLEAANDGTKTPKFKGLEARLIATPRTVPRTPVERWKQQSSTPSRVLQDRRGSENLDLSSFLKVSFQEQEKSQAGTSTSYLSNFDSLLTSRSDPRSYSSSSFEDSSDFEVNSID